MKKIIGFFRKFIEKRSYQIVFFIVSMCAILGAYFILRLHIAEEISHRYTVVEDKCLIKFVEEASVEGDELTISGWCFYKDIDSKNQEIQIFLRNVEDDSEEIWLDVEQVNRADVHQYYDCAYDYSQTGFEARIETSELNLMEKDYEIFLKLNLVKESRMIGEISEKPVREDFIKTVSTKNYICDGLLTALEPNVDNEPVFTDSLNLNTIFDKGRLLVHREDYDMYVYQYEGMLYWVAGKDFFFEEDGTTYIQFQLDTSRIDKLPMCRLENEWYWDNIGFNFEEYEITEKGFTPYRVAAREIPVEYPVLCFWTGYNVNMAWVWEEYLNLDIREID